MIGRRRLLYVDVALRGLVELEKHTLMEVTSILLSTLGMAKMLLTEFKYHLKEHKSLQV